MIQINLNKRNKRGFTLIELLLVVSLIGIAFGVTSDILISLVRSQVKTQVMNSLEQQANFVSLKIEKDLRNAYAVVANSDGSDGFEITGRVDGVAYTVVYKYTGSVITRQEDSLSLPLTDTSAPGGVAVTCLSATCFSVSGVSPTLVTVSMKFSPFNSGSTAITPANTGFVDINTTFVVRGTY
jgi:prepilin-type N-terminal cleavage/methylation domain-containing protein